MFSETDLDLPLQLYQLHNDAVRCFRALPDESLTSFIYYYWWLEVQPGETELEVIPDNAMDVVMSPDIPHFSLLYLPEPMPFTIPLIGPVTYIGISIRPQSAEQLLSASGVTIKNCVPGEDVTETLALEKIVAGVQGLKQPETLASALDILISARLESQASVNVLSTSLDINKVIAAMQATVGTQGMRAIADRFGMSDRQFRRIMGSLFGYGPKKVQRVMRLQASLKEILAADPDLLEDGFYDEAHKIKEIRALTGLTPGQLKKMSEIYNSM